MIRFILNEKEITTDLPAGMVLLDFLRYHQHLMGTKIGCREGDCGACTVLIGSIKNNQLEYQSMVSCLLAIGNLHGKHVVSIEGINFTDVEKLNPIQEAMADAGATQCGFCTPGFVMSLAGFCLSAKAATNKAAIAAIDGNICRCTGYKSIERAAFKITEQLQQRKNEEPTEFCSRSGILPAYFSKIKTKLQSITNSDGQPRSSTASITLGGGTDLYVQKHEEMIEADLNFKLIDEAHHDISIINNRCIIGGSATVTDLLESDEINSSIKNFPAIAKLVSSTPIRNMATVAGNFVNASPIGDLSILFLALDATLVLTKENNRREIPLRAFFKDYKKTALIAGEQIEQIWFEVAFKDSMLNFEKVSKRQHLDIATVNTAINISFINNKIANAAIAAGGVGPVPLYLEKTSRFLTGKDVNEETILEAVKLAAKEISPISDARGSKEYKAFLLTQLIKAHFIELFPELKTEKLLIPA